MGVFGREGRRNAPALINRRYGRAAFFWDGRVATLEEQVLKPIEDTNEMDLPVADAASARSCRATLRTTFEALQVSLVEPVAYPPLRVKILSDFSLTFAFDLSTFAFYGGSHPPGAFSVATVRAEQVRVTRRAQRRDEDPVLANACRT